MICQCCGNDVHPTSAITMYWLLGNNYVYSICYQCQDRPFRKAVFLNQKQDLTNDLLKRFGLSLGYTKEEVKSCLILK